MEAGAILRAISDPHGRRGSGWVAPRGLRSSGRVMQESGVRSLEGIMKYMIAAPDLSETEIAYVNECLRTNWISSKGRFIEEFETSFAHFLGRKHAVATCNGTIA